MSDTPRTDEAVDYASNFHPDCEVVNVEVAIDLERELAEIKSDLDFRRGLAKLQESQLNNLRNDIVELAKQRDTLAEALRNCVLWAECMSMRCERDRDNINWSYLNDARVALAAVKGGSND